MSALGFKTAVYHGDLCLGELDTIPVNGSKFQFPNNEIRIVSISPNSERCPPLAILQTISTFFVRCKLESSLPNEQPDLIKLHAACFYEFKTAVVLLGDEEIHLVAMPSKQKKFPCFWCYSVPSGLYNACLGMLNLRCLAIVFDLDETLIVANTMKSFEDKIDGLRAWISRELDPMRMAGMSAELKRYVDDRMLLKQFCDNDFVTDNGRILKVQHEEVPLLSDGQEKVLRPVIRLQDKNIVLTRINPEIRDTSVLVRLRPAWEDLRSYLTAKGRKRFEVYVCTMAERNYALEMWRLLDPELSLISSKQLQDRVVCVKSGSKKSLLNVFQDGVCHPKMAMVIDDRLKVWEDKDQPQVHVVPAFAPYYAPQAETANAVPVLCVARNVACNVRGSFFREFDEGLLRRISDVFYEDEAINLPHGPEVSNCLISEDAGFVPNGTTNAPFSEGISGVEVQHRLNQSDEKSRRDSASNNLELRPEISQPAVSTVPSVTSRPEPFNPPVSTISGVIGPAPLASQKPSLLGAPTRRDLSSSGQPPIISKPPVSQSQGGWLVEEENNNKPIQNRATGASQGSETPKNDKLKPHSAAGSTSSGSLSRASEALGKDLQKHNGQPSDGGSTQNHTSLNGKEFQTEVGKLTIPSHLAIGVLQEIGRRCSSKVDFRSVLSTSKDLQFSIEVLFNGEKIGNGMGKTRKDAQQQAAVNALHTLADKYLAFARAGALDRDLNNLSLEKVNGYIDDNEDPGSVERQRESGLTKESSPEATGVEHDSSSTLPKQEGQKRVSSPRLIHPIPSKRLKEGVQHS